MSTQGDLYIKKIKNIDDELKRVNARAKILREKKKATQSLLYTWMKKKNIQEYEMETLTPKTKRPSKRTKRIVLDDIAPKDKSEKVKRKSKKEKRTEVIKYFADLGVNDPVEAYNNLNKI